MIYCGWGNSWWGIVYGLIVLGLLFLAIRWIIGTLQPGQVQTAPYGPGETALDILKRRYARGEISREEFQRMKQDVQ